MDEIDPYPCKKCELWDRAAVDNGYQYGMCGDCYDKNYVTFKLPDELKEWISKRRVGDEKND